MSDEPSRTSFPKLNDSNYGTWAIMMEALLTSKDLFTDIVEVIVDTVDSNGDPRPQSDVDAEIERKVAKRPKSKLAQARAEMILRVEPGQLAHMRSKDPLAVWQDLQTVHRARGFAASLAQRKKFLSMKMSKNQSMTSWIGEVKEQAFNMTEAGMEVSEHDQILAMTGGLPSNYSTTIATFDSTPPSSLTLDYVVAQLLSAETQNGPRPRLPSTPVPDTGDALAVQSATRCYICDETGHVKRDCPFRSAVEQLKKKKTAGSDSANLAIGLDDDSDGSDAFE